MKLPRIGAKVELLVTLPKVEFGGVRMHPLVRKGSIGKVTKITYPMIGGVREPHVCVEFASGYEVVKPMTSEIVMSDRPMTFHGFFEVMR